MRVDTEGFKGSTRSLGTRNVSPRVVVQRQSCFSFGSSSTVAGMIWIIWYDTNTDGSLSMSIGICSRCCELWRMSLTSLIERKISLSQISNEATGAFIERQGAPRSVYSVKTKLASASWRIVLLGSFDAKIEPYFNSRLMACLLLLK